MDAQTVSRTDNDFTLQMKIPYCKTMLEFEEMIQVKLKELESAITQETLKKFNKQFSKNYRVIVHMRKTGLFI